jgi:cytochrome P450
MGALFAAQLNSGMNAAWILCYLGHAPKWQSLVLAEIKQIAAKYNTDISLPLLDQLPNIPVEAWESDFRVLDACLRDSIRLQLLGTAFRRNVSGKDLHVGDEVVPNGAFVTYHLGDTHQDPALFPDPEQWDPSRHLDENAAYRKVPHGYVGWGSGRHPCLGMRFAKLEMSVVLAYFVAAFEFQTVEKDGRRMEKLPKVDQNGHAAMKPSRPVFLKAKERTS